MNSNVWKMVAVDDDDDTENVPLDVNEHVYNENNWSNMSCISSLSISSMSSSIFDGTAEYENDESDKDNTFTENSENTVRG